jgi:hypothetical protein
LAALTLVMREFKKAGISRATLARRLGKRPEQVSRLLGGPGNWTLDTVSDLLFAINGAEPEYATRYPFEEPPQKWPDDEIFQFDLMTKPTPQAQKDSKISLAAMLEQMGVRPDQSPPDTAKVSQPNPLLKAAYATP